MIFVLAGSAPARTILNVRRVPNEMKKPTKRIVGRKVLQRQRSEKFFVSRKSLQQYALLPVYRI